MLLIALAWPRPAEARESPDFATLELIERRSPSGAGSEVALSTLSEGRGSLDRLLAVDIDAGGLQPDFLGGISWSPDGADIAFAADTKTEGEGSRAIYMVKADGSGLRRLPGTGGGTDPVFAPDGTALAFARSKLRLPKIDATRFPPVRPRAYSSTTTWLLDLSTGKARRLSAWQNGLDVTPGSISPDGSTLAVTRRDRHRRGPEILLMPLAGGAPKVIADLAEEPDFSPAGSRLAFVGYRDAIRIEAEENKDYLIGELYSIGADGRGVRRLTDNRAIESSPAWDPSGSRLAFVEARPDAGWMPGLANLFPFGNRIREMNADGSCMRTVRAAPKVAVYGVSWRPASETAPSSC